jgi:hypothetical protein
MRIPPPQLWTRWIVVLWALLLFYWLGLEDDTLWPVVILGMGSSLLLLMQAVQGRYGGQQITRKLLPYWAALVGAIIGLGGGLCTAALMLFKNVRHAHILPDYPVEIIGAVLGLMPIWAIAGAMIAASIALLWIINTQVQS